MTYYITCMQTFLKLFQVWIYVDHQVCYNYIVSLVVCPEMHTKTRDVYTFLQKHTQEFKVLYTYILWMPAFLTADDTALTAVCIKLMSCEKSPVAEGCFFCSANINLVRVMGSVSMGLAPLILILLAMKLNQCQRQCARLRVIS